MVTARLLRRHCTEREENQREEAGEIGRVSWVNYESGSSGTEGAPVGKLGDVKLTACIGVDERGRRVARLHLSSLRTLVRSYALVKSRATTAQPVNKTAVLLFFSR